MVRGVYKYLLDCAVAIYTMTNKTLGTKTSQLSAMLLNADNVTDLEITATDAHEGAAAQHARRPLIHLPIRCMPIVLLKGLTQDAKADGANERYDRREATHR